MGSLISLSPWTMLAVDGGLLLALFCARPWSDAGRDRGHPAVLVLALAASLALPWLVDREVQAPTVDGGEDPSRGFAMLDPEDWVGEEIFDTPLVPWIDTYEFPPDGLFIFYRTTCEHCASHLEQVALEDDGSRPIWLLRLPDEGDSEANYNLGLLPSGPHVTRRSLPEGVLWVLSTPADFVLSGSRVVSAREGIEITDS